MQYLITPISKDIVSAVWWENAFSKEQLDWLQNKAKQSDQDAGVGADLLNSNRIDKNIRKSQVSWIQINSETSWVFHTLNKVVSEINSQFYGFDLTGFSEPLQLANYSASENGNYGWHQDIGHGLCRKLSVSVQLTDASEYEGGNLQLITAKGTQTAQKQRGFISVFPSFVRHQVEPVTKGSRQSLVAWVSGPPFK